MTEGLAHAWAASPVLGWHRQEHKKIVRPPGPFAAADIPVWAGAHPRLLLALGAGWHLHADWPVRAP
jgi:hypothetical protein